MKPIQEFLSELALLDIKLWAEGTSLRCNAPQGILTPKIRGQLSDRKAEIIKFLQDSHPQLIPRNLRNNEPLPLSWAQERLWFLNQLEGASTSYNMPGAFRLTGQLDFQALQQALSEIVRRHEILRTSFKTINASPRQVIHPEATLNIKVVDLQQLAATERETLLEQQVLQEANTPFDLETAPLIRASLWQLTATEYVLLLTMHHIVSDGWSIGIFIQELSALYQAFSTGQPSPLAELPIQYADFTLWQRKWLSGSVLETQLNYWLSQLQDAPELLQLPTDFPRPSIQTYQGKTQSFTLNRDLSQKLQKLSRSSGTTLFMVLQAAFVTLLYRYSGQSDILIGSPIANRHHQEIESLIGFFVNTLVLRSNLEAQPSFEELLSQVRETTLKAYEHQDVPFEKLVEALQPERSLSHSPLFQVMFVWQNAPMGELELPGLTWSELNQESTIAKFDLTLSMSETPQGLVGSWEYNTDLFEGSTIERLATHFQNLCSAIVENPQLSVDEIPLLSEVERHQLLVEWNDTQVDYPSDKCIHQLFEEQVEKTPEAVAVVFEEQQLTYQELNTRANQLAHHLQSLGVGPEVLVGICLERSLEIVVGLLGILKAGGAYVPLDPSYPQERINYMLEDSGVKILLTQEELLSSLSSHTAEVVCLDRDWETIEQQSQGNLETGVCSNNLAYVIYTSGSTGLPKGVMIEHSAIGNHLLWMQVNFPLTEKDKVLQKTPFSFDASVWEFYGPLLTGAQLVIARPRGHQDSNYLIQVMISQQITILQTVPSMLQTLLEQEEFKNCKSLKRVFCGGEALIFKLIKCFFEHFECELYNLYGPTEASIDVTFWQCQPQANSQIIPIGRPIANTQIYILDPHLQPVPIGVSGELHIGGYGLARGYFNRPELTQEKFISHPFSAGKRLYKTGDLARYLPDGNIEYLGRLDNQVKIRGFRIELGEIEAVLNSHSQIQQAVVIAREDIPNNKRLVAYLVKSDESLTTNQLRSFLKEKLPEYMVPSAFVWLETLPLTPNGKIDRKALLVHNEEITREDEYIAPRTPSEEIIANIFALVLGVQKVGIHDNFFTLGGHSLLATQVISRIRLAFEVEIPLKAVFESPTVAQLNQTLTTILALPQQELNLPPIEPVAKEIEQIPLSWAQERLWFLHQLEEAYAIYNMSGAFRFTGQLDINALQQALSEIVKRHEILRTSFQTLNGKPRQIIHPEATLNIKVVDLQQLAPTERKTLLEQQVLQEANIPFDLETAPLIRASLWQLSATKYVLLVTMHHIVSDGWSIGIFIQELSALYQAFSQGQPSPLAELPIQYTDFTLWQRKWLSGSVLETQLNYWQQQLQGSPNLLQLPTDFPRPSIQTYQGKTQSFTLNRDLSQKLQKLSQESGTTLFMTLLAGFATLLYRYSGQSDILIGSLIANRNRSEIESLIGFFVNILVLRSSFETNCSFDSLLTQIRETTLKAYEHQDVPFERVVESLQPERSLSYSPLFQVMFVLQNAPMSELKLPGLTWSELNQESTIAEFDLYLTMFETTQGLVGEWKYNTDLFDQSTIERMAAHFQNLLSAIVENPQLSVDEIPLLSEVERHQLLVEWNDTQVDYSSDKCIHQLFEEQVEKTPEAVAVIFVDAKASTRREEQQLTYQELNTRANQLAHHLQSLGVGPEVLVGICLERSLQMVVGLLGILKAGGAYVPLDPSYPQERINYMLEDSGVKILLTQEELLPSLSSHTAEVVCLDRDWAVIEQQSQKNLETGICSNNLAYVIYTSGSTGRPKGAMNTHQGICNRLLWMQDAYQLMSSERVLQKTPFSFDVSVWEFFWTLITGATIVVARPEGHKDSSYLVNLIAQEQITTIHFVPSMLQVFLQEHDLENCSCLKRVICSGEELTVELTKRFFEHFECELHNLYGPTEAAIDVTFWQCQPQANRQIIPIGRPIANTQIYILDPHLQPVPIGVSGELHIGGYGLARGYLNRPELTQEKFIPHPFCAGELLYKTGDLARYLPDGNIEYLGRLDNQVKIRGFRIELGEIEAVLHSHIQIQQAVVIAREDIPNNKRLVAYLVTSDESLITNQLRSFLKEKLPEYMVPSAFVLLETLPLTPNGKIDRKALPDFDLNDNQKEKLILPRDIIELRLAQIWSSLLNVNLIGVTNNFFELGGHSLLAIHLMSQIQQQFQRNLPLATLFQSPTIEQIAHLLRSATDSFSWSVLVPIKSNGNQPPLFCIHPAGGNVLCYQDLAYYLSLEQPFYALQSIGLNPQQQPHTSIEQMATHYIQELKTVQPDGPYFLAGWSLGGLVAFEMAQQLSHQGEQIAFLALLDSYPPSITSQELEEDDATILVELLREDLDLPLEQLRQLELEEQLIYVVEQAKGKNLVPGDFDLAQASQLLKIYKLNIEAGQNYKPQYYLGSMVLFKATEVDVGFESAWNKLVESPEIYLVPGNHQSMVKRPHVQTLAQLLQKSLDQAQTYQLKELNAQTTQT